MLSNNYKSHFGGKWTETLKCDVPSSTDFGITNINIDEDCQKSLQQNIKRYISY